MGTTARTEPTRRGGQAGARGSARAGTDTGGEDRFDLLTAMLLGLVVGSAVTALVRSSAPKQLVRKVRNRGRRGGPIRRGAEWVSDRVDPSEIVGDLREQVGAAREAIAETVSDELAELRKAVRRRRKRLGL